MGPGWLVTHGAANSPRYWVRTRGWGGPDALRKLCQPIDALGARAASVSPSTPPLLPSETPCPGTPR